jgi:hypothetical protein
MSQLEKPMNRKMIAGVLPSVQDPTVEEVPG